MSFARIAFAPTLPFDRSPDDPAGGGAPPPVAAPAAPATPPSAPPAAPAPPAPAPTLAGGGAPAPAAPAAPAPTAPSGTPAPATLPATLAAGAGAPPAVPADFPADWRDKMAGDDKAFRARLDRFDSPAAVARSYRELEAKISSGELKAPSKPLPANATDEQKATWRKDNGLPESPEAIVTGLQLPNGVVPGEADKPLLENFAKAAFAEGMSQDTYNKVVGWYYGLQDNLQAEQVQADADFMQESSIALAREWGPEFKVNQTAVSSFLEANFGQEFRNSLLAARLPDGSVLGNHPDFNRQVLSIAKAFNPAATLLPASSGATLGNVGDRIGEIEKLMRAPQGSDAWKSYWLGDAGQKLQSEYRDLITARETLKERQGRAA